MASSVLDRVSDVSRVFSTAIDVGCGRGHFAKQLANEDVSDLIGSLYQCDIAEKALVNIICIKHFTPHCENNIVTDVS